MRDRLIEILQEFADGTITGNGHIVDGTEVNMVADYLLYNGVIVPPCKVGDSVWYITDFGNVVEAKVIEGFAVVSKHNLCFGIKSSSISKTAFLTREEAEKALAERSRQCGVN